MAKGTRKDRFKDKRHGSRPPTKREATKVQSHDKQQSSYRFVNPYNFVRFLEPPTSNQGDAELMGRCAPPPHDRWVGLSGRIICELEAVTPLFVSNSEGVQARDEHKSYRFFHYDFGDGRGEVEAIPSSSLRGMVRSVFEAVTNSCLAHFDYGARYSYHLPPADALQLVPARAEKDEITGTWRLRLLTGTATMEVGQRPRELYAASLRAYEKTVNEMNAEAKGRGSFRRGHSPKPIKVDSSHHANECWALLEHLTFPPSWRVIDLHKQESEAKQEFERIKRERGNTAQLRLQRGYVCVNNQNIENKRFERFFFAEGTRRTWPEVVPLPDNLREEYAALIRDYQTRHQEAVQRVRKSGKNPERVWQKNNEWHPAFSRFVVGGPVELQDGDLVYAMLEGSTSSPRVRFIAPVAVPRVAYKRMVWELLPDHLHKCTDHACLCPACRTFGWTYGRHNDAKDRPKDDAVPTAYAGRVRFSHARMTQGKPMDDITLSILGTPKPTTGRFYLLCDGKPIKEADEVKTGYDQARNKLRGRKFYWHHGEARAQEYQRAGNRQDDQDRTVRDALQPGAKFTFEVIFQNLAPAELGALLWSLELEQNLVHRLGYAKPLGFGSVRIKVCELRLFDPDARYHLRAEPGPVSAEQLQAWKDKFKQAMARAYGQSFEQLTNVRDLVALLGTPPKWPIHYPRSTRQPSVEGKNFEWFMGNKRGGKRDSGPRFALPLATDPDPSLPLIGKDGRIVS